MSEKSLIEWTDATWNPVTGCTPVSAGCANCYAKRLHETRFSKNPKLAKYYGKPFDLIQCHEDALLLPLRWKNPRRIFVNSMGDLFHEDVPDTFIDRVFAVMALCPQHTFQILTKRPERMLSYMTGNDLIGRWGHINLGGNYLGATLPNVHLGVSVENQATADERIPLLLMTPADHHFVSAEPLLGQLDLTAIAYREAGYYEDGCYDALSGGHYTVDKKLYDDGPKWGVLDLVIVGGETGPKARPMHPDWARSLRDQCAAAGVPFIFKQWGEWVPRSSHNLAAEDPDCKLWPCVRLTSSGGNGWSLGDCDGGNDIYMQRVGKKRAGRTLDGRTWEGVL